MDTTIKDLGEFGLIEKIKTLFGKPQDALGIGDDCAVLPFDKTNLLVTVDTLIENVHFFSNHPLDKLAIKAININISDIVACGGYPKWAFLSLSLNPQTKTSQIDLFLESLQKCFANSNLELLGGNTTKDDKLSINITLIGETDKPILRSSAKENQDVYVTGKIGCAACGFFAIKNNLKESDECLNRFLAPKARLDLIEKIKPYATAMIDISDGLLQDAMHICTSSNIGMDIILENINLCESKYLSDIDKITFGEDYELLFCADKKYRNSLLEIKDVKLIGYTNNSKKLTIYNKGKILTPQKYGFRHF
ncbi:thiamine-phosphate kinase [Desulfurella sp.]|uniref:thiamine-phosphate kinase n=1 Tax=Desulfurella sp. TaxID=1962857 RepID=UPI0025C329E9|nr:thiamine-phosphate kinase [Desulfurella sp.]